MQFLVYAQTLNYKIDSLGTTSYRLVQFRVQNFLKYRKLSSNYYQLKKLIEFFDELQTNSLIKFYSNHKAFLNKEGKKIIQDRKKDFQFILLIKEPDAYVFTSEANHYQKLRREAITKGVNKIMRLVSKQLPGQPNITSHSFQIGYITQLWRDSKDIEFVKQSIGHQKLNTTLAYVTNLSDQERQYRMANV